MSKPRVTARASRMSSALGMYASGDALETPCAEIEVSYDHDDAEGALITLKKLVADVEAQIKKTLRGEPS